MREGFQKAAWRLDPQLMVTSQTSPVANFVLPAFIEVFFNDLKAQRARKGEVIQEALLYGGSIGDIHKGRRPRDYDFNMVIPDMIANLKKALAPPANEHRSYKDRDEDIEIAIGYDFPASLIDGLPSIKYHPLFGEYIELPVCYHGTPELCTMDIRIVSERVEPTAFLSYLHAPVMAVAVSLEEPRTFTYHRDYADHLERNIMEVADPVPDRLVTKVARKGMTLISPAGP
jgi:hypothetical protein